MNWPLAMDLDLRNPKRAMPPTDRPVQALLWWGDRVLDEQTVSSTDGVWPELRERLLAPRRAAVAALETVQVADTPALVVPGDVTVVVCTRDRADLLEACLDALLRLDPAPAEIIVVDNAPQDTRTAELVKRSAVGYVVEERPGLSHARNAGWRAARTPIVAFTDDDARPHPHWIGAVCRAFATPAVTCVTGLVVAAELMTPAQRVFEANGGMSKGFRPLLFTADSVGVQGFRVGVGANMAFTRSALEAIGGFDVRLGAGRRTRGGEDLDAFVRVLDAGGVAAYEPDAVVRHVHRRDLLGVLSLYRDNGTGYAALLRKYAVEGGDRGVTATRERFRWRRQRHVRSLLGAVRRREPARLLEIAAEIAGSRRGLAAFDAEAALSAGNNRG
jgi:O-antigen biosynthesis protein